MLKIDKIGMEIELGFPGGNCRDHSTFCGVSYADKGGMNITSRFGFKTSISREYYKNQVEFNIPWTKNKGIDMRHKVACLCDKFPEEAFTVSLKGPAYVGTHIHYSFINDKGEPVDYPIKNKVLILMLNIISFYIEYFDSKIKKTKECDQFLVYPTLRNEMERLVKNHNILINWDTKVFDRRIERFLTNKGNGFIYTNGRDNVRYRPIIRSPARPGKPFTMEIRYISNLIGLDQKEITKFNKMVETVMNSHNGYKTKADLETLKNLIFDKYKELYSLYESLNKWRISDSSGNLMTINMYQKWIAGKRLCIEIPKYNIYLSKCTQNDNNMRACFAKGNIRFIMMGLRDIIKVGNTERLKDIYEVLSTYCKKQKIKDCPMTIVSEGNIIWTEEDIKEEKIVLKTLLKNTHKIVDKMVDSRSVTALVNNVITGESGTIRYGLTYEKKPIESLIRSPGSSCRPSIAGEAPFYRGEQATLITSNVGDNLLNSFGNSINYCSVNYTIFMSFGEKDALKTIYGESGMDVLKRNCIELIRNIPDIRQTFGNFHPNIEQAIVDVGSRLAVEISTRFEREDIASYIGTMSAGTQGPRVQIENDHWHITDNSSN